MTDQEQDLEALDRLLRGRHSCRAFLKREVPRDVIESMLSMAQRTASWCNTQPWQLHVTCGDGTQRLRDALLQAVAAGTTASDIPFPEAYKGKYLDRRRAAGFALYEATGVARGDRAASAAQSLRNFELFGAPHALVLSAPRELGTYGAVDCGGWIANFLLAAQAHGVATIAQAALATQSAVLHKHFAIPDDQLVVCGVSFGYEDTAHPANAFRTERAGLAEACTWQLA